MTHSVLIGTTLLALGLRLYQLARPGYLLGVPEYDDGVDFGSAVRLVNGFLPYRDFVFVHPPGITLLMAPVALVAKATTTDTGFAIARILTVLAGAASVPLTWLLTRHRGLLVTGVACGMMAVYPSAVATATTVFLEPWLVLLCLLGALAIFERDSFTHERRRLLLAGLAFGFAGAIKVWAVIPVAVLLIGLLAAKSWRRLSTFLGGLVAGFVVPVLPFFVLAPRSFLDGVIYAQLTRGDVARVSVAFRLHGLFGLSDLSLGSAGTIALSVAIGGFIVMCVVAASISARRAPPALEGFALGSMALVLAAFMWPPDYYSHYATFFAPFLALSLTLPASRVAANWRGRAVLEAASIPIAIRIAVPTLAVAAFVAMAVVRIHHESGLATFGRPVTAQRTIRPGACVLTDESSLTVAANRFVSNVKGCPPIVDSVGIDYDLSRGENALTGAGHVAKVESTWLSAFRRAQYVWLVCAPPGAAGCNLLTNRRIPWTPPILAYFESHFRLLPVEPDFLYVRSR